MKTKADIAQEALETLARQHMQKHSEAYSLALIDALCGSGLGMVKIGIDTVEHIDRSRISKCEDGENSWWLRT
jgi:hypothetical protein